MDMDLERIDWGGFIQDLYGFIGYYEINAVLTGTEVLEKNFTNRQGMGARTKMMVS